MNMRLLLVLVGGLVLPGCFEDITDPTPEASSGSTSDATAADGTADSTAAEPSVCPEYCSLVQGVCTADFAQYTSEAVCLATCEGYPPGNPDDQLGNSLACRRFQAVQAQEMPSTFCGASGPTGNNVCGARCDSFCSLAMELCTGDMAQWPDLPSCLADCMQFPDDTMYNASVTSGNSSACRTYHLTVASLDPGVHCPHIGLDSATCF